MAKTENRKSYNTLKEWDGQKYTGMSIGGKHSWNYTNGIWNETKTAPDDWKFEFSSLKSRTHQAPPGTGALNKTEYHWYITADQKVVKLDENTYSTVMKGLKIKVGHKRPNWKGWSYNLKHESYEDKIIQILQNAIDQLKAKKKERELIQYF
ncbi:MAG TPA: hypothetical protein VMV49_05375 [Candidatus Deferrimicrobium sp.]|nr:hypothetical protein [Candidatus Deferrimicrobium sp.]